jgi:hypothetical protein
MHIYPHPNAPGTDEKEEMSDAKQQVELEAEEFDGLDIKDIPCLQKDPMWKDMYMYVTEQQHNDTSSQEAKKELERECEQYLIKDKGLLCHIFLANGQPQIHNMFVQLCLPRVIIPQILKEMHDEPYAGHRGTGGKECIMTPKNIACRVLYAQNVKRHIDMETYLCYHPK